MLLLADRNIGRYTVQSVTMSIESEAPDFGVCYIAAVQHLPLYVLEK